MFQLYDFNGSVGRDRKQEAVMNSLNDRQNFLEKLEMARIARAKESKQKSAASTIQAQYRKFSARRGARKKMRDDFDASAADQGLQGILRRTRQFNIFYDYNSPGDNERLITVCSQLISISRSLEKAFMHDNTKRLLCHRILTFLRSADRNTLLTMPIRFLEVFCTPDDYHFLSQRGWFDSFLAVIAATTSDPDDVIIQERLPGRLQTFCELLASPVKSAQNKHDMMVRLFSTLLNNDHAAVMYSVVIPFLLRCRNSLFNPKELMTAVAAAETKTNNALILQCHIFVLLLTSQEQQDQDLPYSLFSAVVLGTTTCFRKQEEGTKQAPITTKLAAILKEFLESTAFINLYTSCIGSPVSDMKTLVAVHSLVNSPAILESMCSSHHFFERLYSYVMGMQETVAGFGQRSNDTFAIKLKHGYSISEEQQDEFLPALSMLCSLVCKIMELTLDDDLARYTNTSHFLQTVVTATRDLRDITLGLIDLAFPEDFWSFKVPEEKRKRDAAVWSAVYDQLVKTLQTVHRKNSRTRFLPDDFWTDHRRQVVVSKKTWVPTTRRVFRRRQNTLPFSFVRYLHRSHPVANEDINESDSEMETDDNEMPPNTSDLRNLSIVRSIPFVLPFDQRLKIFQELLTHDKDENGVAVDPYGMRSNGLHVSVRRQNLYEDSFDAFSPGNAPNLKLPMKINMINWAGMHEPGVDGGGIFREFLSELLKTGLDPSRGLFCCTHDGLLYPNPDSAVLFRHDYSQHFYFLGRMVAKLIYEGMMLDVRFADFFLVQLLGSRVTNIDLDQMKSYDPSIYKHLISLLSLDDKQLAELGLDFSVIVDELGSIKTVELKPGGKDIVVNTHNLREYIQLRVNFFLYKRIMPMVDAMRSGVSDVIDPGWLGMFDPSEIQKIVSGVEADIDINDMKAYCEVYNTKETSDKLYIAAFWEVIRTFSPQDKAALLKFITGCPRPPINGFVMLAPNMAIQLMHDASQLPMSATCMNLFKLPKYSSKEEMEKKIRYAIHSGAGFELA